MRQYHDNGGVLPAQWDDLRFPASAVKQNPVTAKPDFDVWRMGDGGEAVRTYVFDGGTDEELHFIAQLPHGFAFGTSIEAHIHWPPSAAPVAGETVIWYLEYALAEIGGVFPAPVRLAAATHTFSASDARYQHILTELGSIDTSGWDSLSGMISCRLFRDADTDTFAGEVAYLEADFHYHLDQVGSREEYVK